MEEEVKQNKITVEVKKTEHDNGNIDVQIITTKLEIIGNPDTYSDAPNQENQ